jgi:hypothetical protein
VSTTAAFLTVAFTLAFSMAAAYWQIDRAKRADADRKRDRINRESCAANGQHVGPRDPRLPAGIDAALDDYVALDPDLAPVFAPGLDRLWQAIRDEQQKGD